MSTIPPKPRLLALDGDEPVLRTIAQLGLPWYNVQTTRNARAFMGWINSYKDVAVIMTEHVLSAAAGVTLLETARTLRPAARRVLITTYHDLASIVMGLHSGAIQRLVQKPFTFEELLAAIVPDGVTLGEVGQRRASA